MTGKEALIQVSKSCSALALEFGNLKTGNTDNEALQTLREIVQKYDKYKRAFEILKDTFGLIAYYKSVSNKVYEITPTNYYKQVAKEEYELLEELMNDDN